MRTKTLGCLKVHQTLDLPCPAATLNLSDVIVCGFLFVGVTVFIGVATVDRFPFSKSTRGKIFYVVFK